MFLRDNLSETPCTIAVIPSCRLYISGLQTGKGKRGTDSKLIVGGLRFVRLRVSIGFYPELLAMREWQE